VRNFYCVNQIVLTTFLIGNQENEMGGADKMLRCLFFCRSKLDISMTILLPGNLTKKTASEKITSP
jgi:hypothetical protein